MEVAQGNGRVIQEVKFNFPCPEISGVHKKAIASMAALHDATWARREQKQWTDSRERRLQGGKWSFHL